MAFSNPEIRFISLRLGTSSSMKVLVTIKYGKLPSETIQLPIADGQKTFKWLGTVAAHRFAMLAPRGSSRQRDKREGVPYGTVLVPTAMHASSNEEDIFHPESLLGDRLSDGQAITVVLGKQQPLDHIHACPVMEPFALLAFNTNNTTKHTLDAKVKAAAWTPSSSSSRSKITTKGGPAAAASPAPSAAGGGSGHHSSMSNTMNSPSFHPAAASSNQHRRRSSSRVHSTTSQQRWGEAGTSGGGGGLPHHHHHQAEDTVSPEERRKIVKQMREVLEVPIGAKTWLQNTFEKPWNQLVMGGAFDALGMPYDEEMLEGIHRLLFQHYPLIMEIFNSFCSCQEGGEKRSSSSSSNLLSLSDFKQFVHEAHFDVAGASTDLLHLVYDRACRHSNYSSGSSKGLVDLAAFMVAVMDLSCTQSVDLLIHKRMSNLRSTELHQQRAFLVRSSPSTPVLPTLSALLKTSIENHLQTYAQHHLMEFLIKREIESSDTLAFHLAEYQPTLFKIFTKNAGKQISAYTPAAMTYFSFRQIAVESGLVQESVEDAMRRVRVAYIAAKRDPPPPPSSNDSKGEKDSYDNAMLDDASFMLTYSEFVGALLRLGVGGTNDDEALLGLSSSSSMSLLERLLGSVSLVVHSAVARLASNGGGGGSASNGSATMSMSMTMRNTMMVES